MFKKIINCTLLMLISSWGFSQLINKGDNRYEIRMDHSDWHFQIFNEHILKISVTPDRYKKIENVSDAVILQPMGGHPEYLKIDAEHFNVRYKNVSFRKLGDTIYIGNNKTCKLISSFSDSIYHGFRFGLSPEEKIYGGGERAVPLNRRGYELPLYNEPHGWYGEGQIIMNYSVPFITSSNNYALFFDNPAKGYLDIGKKNPDVLEYGTCSGELNFYVITGRNPQEILKHYHELTGTQPLPPRWAMGNFMSRFGYRSEAQVTGIFNQMKKDSIPFDAVIFDLFWFGDSIKNGLGNLDWVNPTAWPDPQKMIAGFKKQGVKTILITEPFILENTLSYNKLKPFLAVDSSGKTFRLTDFYFGYGGLLDIFRKKTRDEFWNYYKKQMNIGVEGWWGDLGEPEKHPSNIHHNLSDHGYKRLFAADEVHNIYGHYWTKMLFDKFKQEYPNKRLFSLNRSGFAGSQRYNIFPWSGDVARTWTGYRAQLPIMLGMSMSGIPYIHSDAGGFTGGDKDQELYVRWLQFSSFSPVLRPHGFILNELDPNSPSFPSEAALMNEPYKSAARKAIHNRYHRLPYHYTMCYNQSRYAAPLVSPLYYYFNQDSTAVKIEDEFMYGASLLIAPILEKNAMERKVYLPNGNWYANNENKIIPGGITIDTKAPLNNIPVFVRSGSIIPFIPESVSLQNTEEYSTQSLEWHYYYDTVKSSFVLFDDDGNNRLSIKDKQFELIQADAWKIDDNLRFKFSTNKGQFPGKPTTRKFNLIIHGLPDHYTYFTLGSQKEKMIKSAKNQCEIPLIFDEKTIEIVFSNH